MVYQLIQHSILHNIFGFGFLALIPAMVVWVIFSKMSSRTTFTLAGIGLALFVTGMIVGAVESDQLDARNNASFSKQLMDEYGVTSSRNLRAIQQDFSRFDEARTVFSKDGKETPVSIQLLRKNDKMIIMDFTVIDDKALYPKLSK